MLVWQEAARPTTSMGSGSERGSGAEGAPALQKTPVSKAAASGSSSPIFGTDEEKAVAPALSTRGCLEVWARSAALQGGEEGGADAGGEKGEELPAAVRRGTDGGRANEARILGHSQQNDRNDHIRGLMLR